MKNLMNRVLVVLTISAVFAGNVDAAQQKGKKAAATPTMEQQTNTAVALIEAIKNCDKALGTTTRKMRVDVLVAHYGSNYAEKAPKVVQTALLDATAKVRLDNKNAALKAATESSVKEMTKDLKETEKKLESNPDSPELQQAVAEKKGMLDYVTTTCKSYMTARTFAAAAVALASAGAVYYNVGGSQDFLRSAAAYAYNQAAALGSYLASTRVGQMAGTAAGTVGRGIRAGYETVKQYPGMAITGASTFYNRMRGNTPVVQPVVQPAPVIEEPAYNPEM